MEIIKRPLFLIGILIGVILGLVYHEISTNELQKNYNKMTTIAINNSHIVSTIASKMSEIEYLMESYESDLITETYFSERINVLKEELIEPLKQLDFNQQIILSLEESLERAVNSKK